FLFGCGQSIEQRRGIKGTAGEASVGVVHRDGEVRDAPVCFERWTPDVCGEPLVRHESTSELSSDVERSDAAPNDDQSCRSFRVRCLYWKPPHPFGHSYSSHCSAYLALTPPTWLRLYTRPSSHRGQTSSG